MLKLKVLRGKKRQAMMLVLKERETRARGYRWTAVLRILFL